jgi:hypothetical protein
MYSMVTKAVQNPRLCYISLRDRVLIVDTSRLEEDARVQHVQAVHSKHEHRRIQDVYVYYEGRPQEEGRMADVLK